jgi:hypothetical protein
MTGGHTSLPPLTHEVCINKNNAYQALAAISDLDLKEKRLPIKAMQDYYQLATFLFCSSDSLLKLRLSPILVHRTCETSSMTSPELTVMGAILNDCLDSGLPDSGLGRGPGSDAVPGPGPDPGHSPGPVLVPVLVPVSVLVPVLVLVLVLVLVPVPAPVRALSWSHSLSQCSSWSWSRSRFRSRSRSLSRSWSRSWFQSLSRFWSRSRTHLSRSWSWAYFCQSRSRSLGSFFKFHVFHAFRCTSVCVHEYFPCFVC